MRSLALHPFLFAAFPVLSVYVGNRHELALGELWLPLGAALAAALLVWAGPVGAAAPDRTSSQEQVEHVVQPGENLFRISLRYGTTVDAIMAANGLANASTV